MKKCIEEETSALNVRQREGILVTPVCRLSVAQVELIDDLSRRLLGECGILSQSPTAEKLLERTGARIEDAGPYKRIRIASALIDKALQSAPSRVVLGAREPENRLVLDAHEPRVRFGSGSETNFWLDAGYEGNKLNLNRRNGSVELLTTAAHLCENLEHCDFFIRCVNIRDECITAQNKDVNMYLASLNNTTKHVQAGLTNLDALSDVITMGEIVAGDKEEFARNPVLSFIVCPVKSPLEFVEDGVQKTAAIAAARVPMVIASSAMAGTTGPFDEFGMAVQINSEVLAGIVLAQLVAPGSPVIYGAVPCRTRLDNLRDMYGTPEFNFYNLDCIQMARHYGLPCYTTLGISDASVPGIQATMEKMLTVIGVAQGGGQYAHCAFGVLERSNVWCPEQAVLDDAHLGIVKQVFKTSDVCQSRKQDVLAVVREVMVSEDKTYLYHIPLPSCERVYTHYPLEGDGDNVYAAHLRYRRILKMPRKHLSREVRQRIVAKIHGILPQTLA